MLGSVLTDCKILKIEDSVAAGQAATTSDIIDTQGYGGACFIYKLGAVVDAGAVTLAIYQGAAAAMGDAAALAGGTAAIAVTSTDSEQLLVVDVVKPRERYLRAVLTTATQNGEIDAGICILYNPAVKPVTQPATIAA